MDIRVNEAGAPVLDIRLESVTEPASLDRQQLVPAAGMRTGPVLQDAIHLFAPVYDGSHRRPTIIRQVVVHATFGANGRVMESELAETSDPTLDAAALDFANRYSYSVPTPPGGVPKQTQVYLHINFFMAR